MVISKYANLTYEEYKALMNTKRNEWLKKQSEDKLNKYKEQAINKKIAFCEICQKQANNIYSHNKSKKHMNNLHISNTEA